MTEPAQPNRTTTSADIRRWLGWLALVVVFAIACGFLSSWQFGRRGEALAAMSQVTNNYSSKPVPLRSIEAPWGFHPANEWRQVTLTGHYLPQNAMLVRNRPLDGNAGFLEIVPFQLQDGTLVTVERGWIASDSHYGAPRSYPLPVSGEQTITAHLRAAEPGFGGVLPPGQLASINIAQFVKAQNLKDRIYQFSYVRAASESLVSPEGLQQLGEPVLDEGNHLSYALQWILFALMALSALIWAIRKERQARAGIVRLKRKDADSRFEDDALDA